MSRDKQLRVRLATVAIVSAMTMSVVLISSIRTDAHSGHWIDSEWTTSPPTIDGAMATGEWSDAASADLGAIPGNEFSAYLLIKSDASFLYIAYDATGDRTMDMMDQAAVSFDTGHDVIGTIGGESEFNWGSGASNGQSHLVFDGISWMIEDSPFNTALPNHAGLASAFGYGPSDLSVIDHRIYELQIPLALLNVAPADVIGLLGASMPSPGVWDAGMDYDCWPVALTGPPVLDGYGDLRIGRAPKAADLDMNPPSQSGQTSPSSSIDYTITVENRGTAIDVFDVQAITAWTADLLDSGGVDPLIDNDGDLIPDTGSVGPGSNVQIIVRVYTPASGTCEDVFIMGASSNDPATTSSAVVRTCLIGASLNPPHSDYGVDTDSPPNGLYDELWINVGVMISMNGYYDVMVDLYDSSDMFYITMSGNYTNLPAGPSVVSVFLQGLAIYNNGFDGQYVAHIFLYDDFGSLLDSGTYVTATSYLHTDFDGPTAVFNPPHSDFGNDTDVPPNGLFDELVIEASVNVYQAGDYFVDGILVDQFMNFIAFNTASTYLDIGNQVVPLAYSGLQIFVSGLDGPYTAFLTLHDSSNTLDSDSHTTGAYSCSDFDPLPGIFEPPHSDHGLDLTAPPDGLYEFIELMIAVNVSEATTFEVQVELYDTTGMNYIFSANVVEDLDIGLQTVPVRLDGLAIRNSGFNGPYQAYLSLVSESVQLDADIHMTQAYRYFDFAPEGAAFDPPHSDRIIDDDSPPDGMADLLLVDVNVDVTFGGPYSIIALLVGSSSVFIEFIEVRQVLSVGVSTVTLTFDGHKIAESGIDGPYTVEMLLYDEYRRMIDIDLHMTSTYSSNQFEPFDTTPPISMVGSMPYWKNTIPLLVPYTATDSVPTDGLDSVTLYYQYSTDNSSWGVWTEYSSALTYGNPTSGTMPFTFPMGAGYYQFQTVSLDAAGNQELMGAAEAQVAYLPIAELRFQPDPLPLTAGQQRTLTIAVLSTDGQPAILEGPQLVNLETWSPSGQYRAVSGSTAITSITIPAGSSGVDVDYYDTAAGSWTLLGYTSSGFGGMGAATVIAGSVASIAVVPGAIAIEVAQTQTFTAVAEDAYGNRISGAIITWDVSSSLGTVDATGRFTAGTVVRSGMITARSDSIQGFASIILTPGPATELQITPSSATIQSGTKVEVIAEVTDAYGNVVSSGAIAWTVSGPGTVSPSSGATTELTANGAGTISVTATLGTLSATATFTSVEAGGGLSGVAVAGIAGSLIGGILIGFVIGWILHKRRAKLKQPEPSRVPPPPPANMPPAQPPQPPQRT